MKLIKKYFKILHQIYDYFDYESGGKILPIEDYTEFDWYHSKENGIIYYKSKDSNKINQEDFLKTINGLFSEEGQIYYGQYDKSEMVMFEVYDDVLLIFDAENEIYIDE